VQADELATVAGLGNFLQSDAAAPNGGFRQEPKTGVHSADVTFR